MNDYENALQGWMSGPKAIDEDADDLMRAKPAADHLAALERVKEWVRIRFALASDAAILVSEVACILPGCPPLETAVAFWTKDGAEDMRHHFKMFKRVAEITYDDLPYAWMKDSLVVPEGFECECC
jgi:nitrate reductase delta subunit